MMAALVMAQDDEESIFRGQTPIASFRNNSPNNNPWTDTMTAGAFLGFIVFGISYIYVVIYIFYDINRSKHLLLEEIEQDKQMIKTMNVSPAMKAEWE